MQAVSSFIKLLGKNYYSDFIININSEYVDFDKYIMLVKLNGTYFYELSTSEILIRRKEIINNIKEHYQDALNEVSTILLSQDPLKLNSYIELNVKAIKLHLNILKDDFYIDSNKSRYYSVIEDNPQLIDLETIYQENSKKAELLDDIEIDKKIYEVVYSSDFKKVESFYYLGFLYQRSKALSILPFSLFYIGQQFILELYKVKSLNDKEQININTVPKSQMKDTYFDKFCELIDDINVLDKYTAIGVMIDLQHCIKEIKSETLAELQEKGVNRNDHLEFKINEVEKRSYAKNANINYIQKWIDEYQISLTDLFSNSIQDNPIYIMINTHYKDMEKFSQETDKVYYLQLDFHQYFCKYYADELIEYFKSKMTTKKSIIETEAETANQLSVNQAVILLDRLGLFSSSKLENLPNTKKAKLISQLIGKNEKNIKTAIEKLELKPSEIKPNYQKDLDKIQQLLNNLE
ncbi:hypothetical protein [Flavobacterium faecale]|uniref:hypothetical protein n=1 Tax=Flavobacterium faecale TaxID=1355330 RepID=UPI003AAEDF80